MSQAWAQTGGAAAPTSGPGMILSFAPFIVIFVLFYFLLMRPQQQKAKQRKEMIDQLKKGERVMTTGGMLGTVVNLSGDTLTLQISEGVRIKVRRNYVEEVIVAPETSEGEK
jgi:preprotein translocase subunit YajC